ncbi:MAG: MMPL family transporter, partial [Rhodothermales bacterium]|nr:MMPL family transporter [Rhodothermales bacterium]
MTLWSRIAHWILDHRTAIVVTIAVLTVFFGYWATRVETDHTSVRFIDDESELLQEFRRVSAVFGQSQTMLYLVFDGADPYDPAFLEALADVTREIDGYAGVEQVLSLANVPYLVKQGTAVVPRPLYSDSLTAAATRARIEDQRFLRGLLLSNDGSTSGMVVKIEREVNNSKARIALVHRIEDAAEALPGEVALAGIPYVRTQYAERVTREAPLFTVLALLVSLLFLYLTFRAWRPVLLPTLIVALGIAWTLGLMALFEHRLNIVTSILPALLVIIGMANAIHLSTKFYDQYRRLQDRRAALVETIRTVGMATFLTCFTTAIGFAVLVFSGSPLLIVFGWVAAVGIMFLYALSVTLIPLAFTLSRPPAARRSGLSGHDALTRAFDRLALATERHATAVMLAAVAVIAVGVVGITRIPTDLYVFSDFYEDDPMRQDLAVFEQHFGGVLPMEVVIEADRAQQFRSLGNLRRLDRLKNELAALEPVGRALAATDLVMLANQAYFGGNPATYRLPSSYELPFLQAALRSLLDQGDGASLTQNLPRLVDSTFSITRIYLGVGDIGTARMNALADTVRSRATALFPAEQFRVYVTGGAVLTTRSGENLVTNLLVSLAAALVLISALMALLFRSSRLLVISLLPNVIPLVVVGGAMGFAGVALKPSTALIFSIAFGIAVDSSIHFLSKYRLLRARGLPLNDAVR